MGHNYNDVAIRQTVTWEKSKYSFQNMLLLFLRNIKFLRGEKSDPNHQGHISIVSWIQMDANLSKSYIKVFFSSLGDYSGVFWKMQL